jgi:hypothetical protein
LKEVWALDSTYSCAHVNALECWARKRPDLKFTAVLSTDKDNRAPLNNWNSHFAVDFCPKAFDPPANLKMQSTSDKHCTIPMKWIEKLLSAMPS